MSDLQDANLKLSIIIVNWNTKDLLRDCLASIYSKPCDTTFDVWVVDNASSDNSCEMVKTQFPQVRLIANEKNLGYGKANNIAIRKSKSEAVLLLNSDTVIEPSILDDTFQLLRRRRDLGAIGCKLIGADGEVQSSYNTSYPSGPLVGKLGKEDSDGVIECAYVWGAYIMVKREVIDKIGGIDEKFFMFYEDVDWCWQMLEAGWKIGYYPHRSIKHICRASCSSVDIYKKNFWMISSECLLYIKHHQAKDFSAWRVRRMLHHGWCGFNYKLASLFKHDERTTEKKLRHNASLIALKKFHYEANEEVATH